MTRLPPAVPTLHLLGGAAADVQAEQAHWLRVRRPERDGDRVLSEAARQWLRRLPVGRRPQRLCAQFPRVANRLAWCWHDPDLAAQALDDLLVDRRGGRRGFPPAIVRELQRLRAFNEAAPAVHSSAGAETRFQGCVQGN